jgi:hypothetical protein
MGLSEFIQRQSDEYGYLESMRIGIQADPLAGSYRRSGPTAGRYVGSYSAGHLEVAQIFDPMLVELRTYLLSDKLAEERIHESRTEDHECVRFATWWDHWKATYRGRWWMRWRKWTVRYNIEHHPLTAKVVVDMTRYWTFPGADIYPSELGGPVPFIKNQRIQEPYAREFPSWDEREETL